MSFRFIHSFIHSFIHPLSLPLSRCFYPVFFHIQMLWELVLLGEALVVMAPSPAESSDTVLALVRWVRQVQRLNDLDDLSVYFAAKSATFIQIFWSSINPFFKQKCQIFFWFQLLRSSSLFYITVNLCVFGFWAENKLFWNCEPSSLVINQTILIWHCLWKWISVAAWRRLLSKPVQTYLVTLHLYFITWK